MAPTNIVAGHDGNLWFAESGAKRIGRITPAGVVTEFNAGTTGFTGSMTVAKNGDIWFTEGEAGVSRGIGRITPDGDVTEFDVDIPDDSTIADITGGPDGNVWFTDANSRIGRITPAGDVTFFDVPGDYDVKKVNRIAAVGDALWFTVHALQRGRNLVRPCSLVGTHHDRRRDHPDRHDAEEHDQLRRHSVSSALTWWSAARR